MKRINRRCFDKIVVEVLILLQNKEKPRTFQLSAFPIKMAEWEGFEPSAKPLKPLVLLGFKIHRHFSSSLFLIVT